MLDAGELSAIAVTYPYEGDDISFSISDSGSIVIFSSITNEEILNFIKQLLEDMKDKWLNFIDNIKIECSILIYFKYTINL